MHDHTDCRIAPLAKVHSSNEYGSTSRASSASRSCAATRFGSVMSAAEARSSGGREKAMLLVADEEWEHDQTTRDAPPGVPCQPVEAGLT